MKQLHKRIALYVMLMTLIPASVSGAGLGKIRVKSALGEPLDAEIELLETSPEETKSLTAKVASEEDYSAAGLQDSYIPQGVRVQIIRQADNSRVLHVTSDRPVNEPFLELLIKAESPTTNLLRQYTLLLDPPTSRLEEDSPQPLKADTRHSVPVQRKSTVSAELSIDNIPEPTPHKTWKSVKSKAREEAPAATIASTQNTIEPVTGDTYLTQSGDVFGKVAQRYQPEGVSLKKVMKAFYAANPDAFVDGDMNQLKAGQTLRIPSQETMHGGAAKQESAAAPKAEKPSASTDTRQQAVKLEPSPKFVLKISPGDTDAAANEKAETAASTPSAAPANATPSNTAPSNTAPSNTAPSNTAQSNAPTAAAASEASPPASPADHVAGENAALSDTANPADAKAASSPADASPPATVPPAAVKPLSATASAEDQSLVDAIVAKLPWIALGMAIPLIFFVIMYVINRRRLAAMSDIHDYEYTDEAVTPEVEPVEQGLGEIPLYQPSSHQPASSSDTPYRAAVSATAEVTSVAAAPPADTPADPDMDIHEVDPLVEAEIYMSYGRDEQAENILKNALVKNPHKHELSLGLLRIYADRRDAEAFERVASKVYEAAELGGLDDVVIWGKAAILGLQIDAANPLYRIEGLAQERAQYQADEPPTEAASSQPAGKEFETLDFPDLPPFQAAVTPPAESLDFPDMDLPKPGGLADDVDTGANGDAPELEQEPDGSKPGDKSNVLEFTLDDFMPSTPTAEHKPGDVHPDDGQVDELFPAPKKK